MEVEKKVVVYGRYSSELQNDRSIEIQKTACEGYAEYNKLVVEEYYFDRAKSGRTQDRPEFQRLMKDCVEGKISDIIVLSFDRLSRSVHLASEFDDILQERGIILHSVREQLNLSDSTGRYMKRNFDNSSQFYIERLAENVKDASMLKATLAQNNGGQPILGYTYNSSDDRYEINEGEAKIVKEIFLMYHKGYSYNDILGKLRLKGYKTRRGQFFSKSSLSNILKNEKYTGVYIFNQKSYKTYYDKQVNKSRKKVINNPIEEQVRIENAYEPIIDKELFEAVQEKLSKHEALKVGRRAKTLYLLSGIVYCGICGSKLSGHTSSNANSSSLYYYKCSCNNNAVSCDSKSVRKEYLESVVLQKLQERFFNSILSAQLYSDEISLDATYDKILELNSERMNEIRVELKELRRIEKQTEAKLKEAILNEDSELKIEVLSKNLNEIKNNISLLLQERKTNTLSKDDFENLIDTELIDYLKIDEDRDEKQGFIQNLINRVIVYKDKTKIEFQEIEGFGESEIIFLANNWK